MLKSQGWAKRMKKTGAHCHKVISPLRGGLRQRQCTIVQKTLRLKAQTFRIGLAACRTLCQWWSVRRHGSIGCLPCVCDVVHDGWLCTLSILQQLAAWALLSGQPVRYGKGRRYGPFITKSHLPGHSSPASQAGRRVGPALCLIGYDSKRGGAGGGGRSLVLFTWSVEEG